MKRRKKNRDSKTEIRGRPKENKRTDGKNKR